MAFLIPMRNLLSIKRSTFIKRFFSLLIAFLVMTISSSDIKSQDLLFGFTGGLNMNTISTKSDDGGLKVGFNLGGLAQYKLNEKMSLIANIRLSAKGQQYSKIIENQNDYLKIYHSTSLYYIDFPILFQYHIKDLLGLEIGPSFNFFLSGKDKSKIGNTTSDVRKFEKGSYNPFEFGLTFGIFTRDLGQSSFNNIFIEFRYFIGLTNVITDYGRNVNAGAFLNIGYIIENPLKK
mgnify:FL=1